MLKLFDLVNFSILGRAPSIIRFILDMSIILCRILGARVTIKQ